MGCDVSGQLHTFSQLDGKLQTVHVYWYSSCSAHVHVGLQAWIFAAIDDEAHAAKYYAFAAVYTLPLLRNGFTLDGFLAVAVLICAAHVQVNILSASNISTCEEHCQARDT